jgi:uncharacterized membrane protein YfcA
MLMLIKNTPTWVWILLIFLILRGIKALQDREMRPDRLFLLPIVFFVWSVYAVLLETTFQASALLALAVGIVTGIAVGWVLWCSQPRLRTKPGTDLVINPGSPFILVLILITFCTKFALSATLATHPPLLYSFSFNLLFGFVSGLLDGIFWGRTLNLFVPYYQNRQTNKG